MATFRSQCGEDKWIAENLPLPERGIFVEVGASDGINLSNTAYFEELGWSGLLCEADFRQMPALMRNRKGVVSFCPISETPGLCEFHLLPVPDLSGLARPDGQIVTMCASRLDAILDKHGIARIDLLSIDVEGSEISVWNSFDPDKYKPKVVIAEWSTQGLPINKEPLRERIERDGYRQVHETEYNLIFVRERE